MFPGPGWGAASTRPGAASLGAIQRRQLQQDLLFEPLKRGTRLDPKILDHRGAALSIGPQRVRLAATTVQRQHQLTSQTLPQRVGGDQRLENGGQLAVPSQRQAGLDPVLGRGQVQLGQARDLA